MSKKENYEAKAEELLKPIAEANYVEIYDVEYVKEGSEWYLRCYIDKEEGVSINDCEAVSRALSDELDRTDFIDDAYILEVSSPGLGRTLKKDKHLRKSLLEEVEVKTYKPIMGKKEFTGILKAFDEDTVTLGAALKEGIEDIIFDRKDIAVIKLTLDF
jgi:ribosome maturation factor RimP